MRYAPLVVRLSFAVWRVSQIEQALQGLHAENISFVGARMAVGKWRSHRTSQGDEIRTYQPAPADLHITKGLPSTTGPRARHGLPYRLCLAMDRRDRLATMQKFDGISTSSRSISRSIVTVVEPGRMAVGPFIYEVHEALYRR